MKQIWLRLTANTPRFFRKLQALGLSLSALGMSLQAIDGIPAKVDSVAETLIWLGPVLAVVAQFAVSNTSGNARKIDVK